MAGKTYVTKGYSTHTNISVPQYGYDHGPTNPGNQYVVETKTWAPTPPAAGFPVLVGSPSKIELLKEYVHAPSMPKSPKYAPPAPAHYEGYEVSRGLNYESLSPQNYQGGDAFKKAHNQSSWPMKTSGFSTTDKYRPSSPVHGYPSEEDLIHSGLGLEGARHLKTGNISSTTVSWQTGGPPATRHALTNPTNNIHEALGFLEESVNYSQRADQRRRGVLDDLSTRAQPIEPLSRYARPAFVAKSNDTRHHFGNTGSTINNHEDMRRYHVAHIP